MLIAHHMEVLLYIQQLVYRLVPPDDEQ